MKNKIDITFIITLFNKKEEQLENCLKSIKSSTCNITYDVLIINDGSKHKYTKSYNNLAKKYKAKLYYQKNHGVSSARNLGIKLAIGNYVCFVDADDTVNLSAIHREDLVGMPDLIIYNVKKQNIKGKKSKVYSFENISKTPKKDDILMYSFSEGLVNWSVAKLYSKNFIKKYSLTFKLKIKQGEDLDFVIRFLEKNPNIRYYSRVLYCYKFDISTGDKRIKSSPIQALKDTENDFKLHKSVLDSLSLDSTKKNKLYKIILNDTVKTVSRIYTIYLMTDERAAKKNISLFKDFLNKIGDNNCVLLEYTNKVRKSWIMNGNFKMIKIYCYLRSFYHKIKISN